MNIFYPTFCVPFYVLPTVIYQVSDCVWFVSILNHSYFIRKKKKKTLSKLWLIKYKVEHKSGIENFHSLPPYIYTNSLLEIVIAGNCVLLFHPRSYLVYWGRRLGSPCFLSCFIFCTNKVSFTLQIIIIIIN